MGNNRFKLSDMIPNAWFYKLKDMSKSRKRNGHHVMKNKASSPTSSQRSQPTRYSHYFSIEPNKYGKLYNSPVFTKHSDNTFIDSPRRSSKRRAKRKTIYKPSPTVLVSSPVMETCSCHSTSNWIKPKNQTQYSPNYYVNSLESSSESNLHEFVSSESDESDKFTVPDLLSGLPSESSCRVSSSTNDIIIDMKNEPFIENFDGFDTISQLGLAPILTKPVRLDDKVIEATELRRACKLDELRTHQSPSVKIDKEENSVGKRERKTSSVARISSSNSSGIKLRVNSPKLASKKVQAYARRSVSSKANRGSMSTSFPDGFAVVKSSLDPQRDFRESMVEMIVENNIWAPKALENLLACYLSLNSRDYHDLIVKAFEEIWYDMAQLKM
ncbi:hypothetical protein RJT34_12445 [Clitoria ternatea]|uniref:Transcription repressor n=1 Tax=Clitoria ternatea TaxID=43366 RepID=A0AAN9PKR0_CLITE